MKRFVLTTTTLATLAAAMAAPAWASFPAFTVECADGTLYSFLGDEITAEVACAQHGGVAEVNPTGGLVEILPLPTPDRGGDNDRADSGDRARR